MLGAIVGDIVGSRFEFNNTHRSDFELFQRLVALQMIQYAPWLLRTRYCANVAIKRAYCVGVSHTLTLWAVMAAVSVNG